jgi:hypothetical protein
MLPRTKLFAGMSPAAFVPLPLGSLEDASSAALEETRAARALSTCFSIRPCPMSRSQSSNKMNGDAADKPGALGS